MAHKITELTKSEARKLLQAVLDHGSTDALHDLLKAAGIADVPVVEDK